jgi:hypothetical protein
MQPTSGGAGGARSNAPITGLDAALPPGNDGAVAELDAAPPHIDFPDVPDPVFEAPWFPCPEGDYPEHTVVVPTHDEVVHTISSTAIDADVELPEGSFKAIALRLEHQCPTGGICDLYDRRAVFQLVNQTSPAQPALGLMHYITTYRFNPGQTNHMCSFTDVTQYASLLKGTQTFRSWLDTIVEPGHAATRPWRPAPG